MAIPPLTRSIGSAERAMRALLERELAREQLSFPQWTTLVFARAAPTDTQQIVQQQLAGHVVKGESEGHEAVASLIASGTLTTNAEGLVQHSEKGIEMFARLSRSVKQITNALYGDLPETDLDATQRTLLKVAARAAKLLDAG